MKKQIRPSHGGKSELHKSKDGLFFFILKASNGQTIVTSETYTQKQNAMKAIKRYFLIFTFKDLTK